MYVNKSELKKTVETCQISCATVKQGRFIHLWKKRLTLFLWLSCASQTMESKTQNALLMNAVTQWFTQRHVTTFPVVRLVVIDIVSEGLEMRHSKDGGKVWEKFSVVLTTCFRVANLVVYVSFTVESVNGNGCKEIVSIHFFLPSITLKVVYSLSTEISNIERYLINFQTRLS